MPGKKTTKSKCTTFQQVVALWEEERRALGYVQPYTARKSKQKALLLAPWIGETDVSRIEPLRITEALVELSRSGGRKGQGLSSATLRSVHLAGTQAVDWAMANGLAKSNPFHEVARPRARYRPSQFLTLKQSATLAETMASEATSLMREGKATEASFRVAACIALATGMRRGEIFALDWCSVDFANLRINVAKAVKADGSIGLPKSSHSLRSVAIGANLAKLLDKARAWQEMNLPQQTWTNSNYIIRGNDGERASMNVFEHWWRNWADSNGLPGLRFHELRHTHATLLIASGVDVKTVQLRLGHSSADITMSCYAHAIPLSDGPAAAELDASLFS